jgi:hypothetical protein
MQAVGAFCMLVIEISTHCDRLGRPFFECSPIEVGVKGAIHCDGMSREMTGKDAGVCMVALPRKVALICGILLVLARRPDRP